MNTASAPVVRSTRATGSYFAYPSIAVLLVWMIIPLAMTLWFSFRVYLLLDPTRSGWAGWDNYEYLVTDPDFWASITNTLVMLVAVLAITVVLGVLLAVLFNESFPGRNIARVLAISPFFVMPTVSALVWKNMMLHPVYGVVGAVARFLGFSAPDFFTDHPLSAIVAILSWEWLPYALLVLLTAVQSLDGEQKEAALVDGAGPLAQFWYLTLPHLSRAIGVVVMVETIFLLAVFAEIYVTTNGGPGNASTNLAYLIFRSALQDFNAGAASAGGMVAVVLANIVAFLLVRTAARGMNA